MTVAPLKPNPKVAAVREVRGQLVSGMAVAPPARGHALLPPSDCWPEVCARSAGASALLRCSAQLKESRVVDSTLWKKVTVNAVVKDLGTVNLRYGDLNGDNKVEVVQGTFPNETVIGDGLVYEHSESGQITPLTDLIYLYDWRADFDRNLDITPSDFLSLKGIKDGNTIGDSLE